MIESREDLRAETDEKRINTGEGRIIGTVERKIPIISRGWILEEMGRRRCER